MNTKGLEKQKDLIAREVHTCKDCGGSFSAAGENEVCPVCMLPRALAGGVESAECFAEDTFTSPPEEAAQRLEHYEFVTDKRADPVELGRGAMGVTCNAFDIDLRCP